MVHKGIEYGDMQLIAEVYDLFRRSLGLSAGEMQSILTEWNKGELHSYLIEITAAVLGKIDDQSGKPLVDVILYEVQQKGTGK
jgi:6-phosphogluconate dehydrogenase